MTKRLQFPYRYDDLGCVGEGCENATTSRAPQRSLRLSVSTAATRKLIEWESSYAGIKKVAQEWEEPQAT